MPAILHLLTISIGMDPNIAKFGSLQLTWHGIFTAVGIAAGVYLGAWLGRRQGITEDDAYSVALVGVPAGIIGARAMYVLENHARFSGQWLDVLRINEGGISIYGAVIGGVLGAVAYGWIRKLPITRGLDAAGFGLLLGMGIGRIGDLINGEHVAKASSLPWATEYTNPASPSFTYGPTHPATTYEMIGDFLIIGIMAFLFAKLWQHRPGITFFVGTRAVLGDAFRRQLPAHRQRRQLSEQRRLPRPHHQELDVVSAGGVHRYVGDRHGRARMGRPAQAAGCACTRARHGRAGNGEGCGPLEQMTEVTLYRRRECSLCDDALFELRHLSSELRFTLVERDIDGDAELRARYNDIIPVVAIGESVIAQAPIDLGELRASIESGLRDRREQRPADRSEDLSLRM